MSWWRRLRFRKKMEEELEKELRFHLDQHTADLIAQGLDPGSATRGPARARRSGASEGDVPRRSRDAVVGGPGAGPALRGADVAPESGVYTVRRMRAGARDRSQHRRFHDRKRSVVPHSADPRH